MSRLYYPPRVRGDLAAGEAEGVDIQEASKKVAKLVPAELITGYMGLIGAANAIDNETVRIPLFWGCFALCLILTPFYLDKVADRGKPKLIHIALSTLAFPIWAYLVSGQLIAPGWYDAGIATLLTLAFTLISGCIPLNK